MPRLVRDILAKIQHREWKRRLSNGKNTVCYYCHYHLKLEYSTLDHVIPLSKGGKDIFENVVLCCKTCNTIKNDLTVQEFKNKLYTDEWYALKNRSKYN